MRAQDPFVPRLVLGTLGGTLAGAVGLLTGLVAGVGSGDCSFGHAGGCSRPILVLTLPVLGLWSFSSFAVLGVGHLLDGHASLWPVLAGGFLGSVAMIAPIALFGIVGILAAPLTATAGAIIGYEKSHAEWQREQTRAPRASADLPAMPVFGMTRQGGITGGIVGRF